MYLDILIGIIILIGIFIGIKNGIFIEIISIFGFVVNIVIAKIYTPNVLKFFKKLNGAFENNYILTYVVTFITVYLLISMILVFVKKALSKSHKGFLNRLLGGFLGFLKSLIVSLVIILVYTYSSKYAPSLEKYSERSRSIELFYEIIPSIEDHIPEVLLENFNKNATMKIIEKNLNRL